MAESVNSKYVERKWDGMSLLFQLLLLVICPNTLKAQTGIDYSVHANIIYHFTKYINWPDNTKSGDFVIGVIGETPLFEELQNATLNKKAGNQKIVIKSFSGKQSFYDCQILFISEDESSCLKNVSTVTHEKPVLIVTERKGLALAGSCINFTIVNSRLKLEINKDNIEKRNLKIASELLSLGTIVQ
jgi:hypothetical protein